MEHHYNGHHWDHQQIYIGIEVVFVEGPFNKQSIKMGQLRKVSLVVRCPL